MVQVQVGDLVFNSEFDSGNLHRVALSDPSDTALPPLKTAFGKSRKRSSAEGKRPAHVFMLWTRSDGSLTGKKCRNRSWFHFHVQAAAPSTFTGGRMVFRIMNLNRLTRLFGAGMTPVVKIDGEAAWERLPEPPSFGMVDGDMHCAFDYTFAKGQATGVSFAYTFPYSYGDLGRRLLDLERAVREGKPVTPESTSSTTRTVKKASSVPSLSSSRIPIARTKSSASLKGLKSGVTRKSSGAVKPKDKTKPGKSIYFHRETLIQSRGGLDMDMVTISSMDGITDSLEPRLEGLFPHPDQPRSQAFDCKSSGKQYFVLSARVHPSETMASFMLDGLLNFLVHPTHPRAKSLRSRYVFKVIPMLNPDGVFHGHYRTDLHAVNLNRVYDNPDQEAHPTIWAVKQYLHFLSTRGSIHFYMDMHGHANKFGCFLFGNHVGDPARQAEISLFAKTMRSQCRFFSLAECDFSLRGMQAADKAEEPDPEAGGDTEPVRRSKVGSGRVAMFHAFGITHSYTLEVNYHCTQHDVRQYRPLVMDAVGDGKVRRASEGKGIPHAFAISDWHDIGKSIGVSVSELHDKLDMGLLVHALQRNLQVSDLASDSTAYSITCPA